MLDLTDWDTRVEAELETLRSCASAEAEDDFIMKGCTLYQMTDNEQDHEDDNHSSGSVASGSGSRCTVQTAPSAISPTSTGFHAARAQTMRWYRIA